MLIANTGCKQCPDTTWCRIPPHSATQNDILNILGHNETQSLGGAAEEHVRMRRQGMLGEILLGLADVKVLVLDEVGNRRSLNTFLQHQAQPHGEEAR